MTEAGLDERLASFVLPYLRTQLESGRLALFTGAGFSRGAVTPTGTPIALPSELRDALWTICFPGEPFEDSATLPLLYEQALRRHARELAGLLRRTLTVDASSLPGWYETYFLAPWYRAYTLNADDLPA